MHGISPCEIKGESCSEFLPSISKLWEMRSWAFTNIFSTRQKTISNLIVFLYIKYIQATGLLATSQQNVINEATFRTESSSVSNDIKFQIFQNRFHNVQPFSISQIKYFNVYADNCNYGHNILRFFDVWPNFPSTSSKAKPDF